MEQSNTLYCYQPSICIPRVASNITKETIISVLNRFNLGQISRIDMIQRNFDGEMGSSYQKVFIHFNKWNDDAIANQIRTTLLSGKDVKIIYDSPWFWKLSANKFKKN
jgi:hypothetical protein